METQSSLNAEEKYVQENSLKCKLFIHPETHLSRIAVTDEQNKIRLIQEMPTEDFFKGKAGILNLRFLKTFLVVSPKKLSLIPQDLYEDGKDINSELLLPDSGKHYFSIIEKHNCVAGFLPCDNQNAWLSVLKDAELIPSSKIMINYLTDLKVKYKTILGLNFNAGHFEAVLLEDNNLQFYSQFPCSTPYEFNFFLLTLFEKLALTPALAHFYLWGDIKEGDENYKRLAKYSRNLTFTDSNFLIGATECE